MKKTLLLTILALLGITQALAQEYEYVPFVREGVKWVYSIYNSDVWNVPDPRFQVGLNFRTLELKGDTVINGKSYKAMHKYSGDAIDPQNDTIPVYLREEDKVVYGIIPDGHRYYDCPIKISWLNDEYNGQEFVLYDFNDQASFWDGVININEEDDDFECLSTDIIPLGTHQAKRYINRYGELEFYLVEGVGIDWPAWGYTLYFFMALYPNSPIYRFSHVIEDDQIIYKGFWFDPALFGIPGDVNGDGEINIADANSVIDIVIMGGNSGHSRAPAADVNDDGEINIADVNAIIDIILNGN